MLPAEKSTRLPMQVVFGTINSFPVGKSNDELERVYLHAYRTILKLFYRFPKINFTLHFSGMILDWLEQHHGEFTSALTEMIKQKHVELLLAGHFDPILSLIPRPDRIGQLEYMSTRLRKLFGQRIRGAWLTEQFWQQDMVSSFSSAGIAYTFLDDYHFDQICPEPNKLHQPCITEDQNKTLFVFPVSHQWSSEFWQTETEVLLLRLKKLAIDNPGKVLSIFIDAQKGLGSSEKRDDRLIKLEAFLDGVQELQDQDLIKSVLPQNFVKVEADWPLHYFSCTNWQEMQNFTRLEKVKGQFSGSIRDHLMHFPEAKQLYCKMQYVHSLVNQVRGDKYRKQAAREELWRGQYNAPYWKGSSNGPIYNRLRKTNYSSLIKAEKHTREKGIFVPALFATDFDYDGLPEVLYQGNEINAYLHQRGGNLFELDYLQSNFNYLDTYADQVKQKNGSAGTALAAQPLRSFTDCFAPPGSELQSVIFADVQSKIKSLGAELYRIDELRKESFSVRFVADYNLLQFGKSFAISIRKTYTFNKAQVFVGYQITNHSSGLLKTVFCPSMFLGFKSDEPSVLHIYRKEGRGKTEERLKKDEQLSESQEIYFEDFNNRVVVHCLVSQSACWWQHTIYGFVDPTANHYQANQFSPRWLIELEPGFSFDVDISLSFTRLRTTSSS